MKHGYLLLFILCTFGLHAQTQMSAHTRNVWQQLHAKTQGEVPSNAALKAVFPQLPLYEVNGVLCLSLVAQVAPNAEISAAAPFFVTAKIGQVAAIKYPVNQLPKTFNHPEIQVLEIAQRIRPDLHRVAGDVRADSVWAGFNLPKGFAGENVLIGVSDWGFDYGHPVFYDTTLTQNRIHAAWDQFKQVGPSPAPFGYGVAYTTPNAIATAQSDTASTYYDFATHGTHVAGIAAGSGGGTPHRGIAFGAQLLFASQLLDEGAAIDAFVWMQNTAQAAGKRLVINLSWGLYNMGPLDGTSLLSAAINQLTAENVVIVTSAGNNGDDNFHIKKDFQNDSVSSRVVFFGYNQHRFMWGQAIHMWGTPNAPFATTFEVHHSINGFQTSAPIYQTQLHNGYYDSILLIGTDTVFYNFTVDTSHPLNNRPHITLKVKNTNTQLRIILKSFAQTGTVHYWNVVELTSGVGNWGLPLQPFGPNGTMGNSAYSLGEPASTAGAISVAAHISDHFTLSGMPIIGARANFSSKGPTMDERPKPDLSAPGAGVISATSSFTTENITPSASTNFNGKTYYFAGFSGTSMSSPAVAGVAALLLDANPQLSAQQVKAILKATARTDVRTGAITTPGSTEWGMGKVTANAAVQLALTTVRVSDLNNLTGVAIFPNPTGGILHIHATNPHLETGKYQLTNTLGQPLMAGTWQHQSQIDLTALAPGMYLLQLHNQAGYQMVRIVKQ